MLVYLYTECHTVEETQQTDIYTQD